MKRNVTARATEGDDRDSSRRCLYTAELAPPGPGEVMVKIAAAGLCHSDLSVINGDRQRPMPMAARKVIAFD